MLCRCTFTVPSVSLSLCAISLFESACATSVEISRSRNVSFSMFWTLWFFLSLQRPVLAVIVQRTCVGWAARSVRSLRHHGTVLCLADSARTSQDVGSRMSDEFESLDATAKAG